MKLTCIRLLITAGLCAVITASGAAGEKTEITVSAAISLKNAFDEIGVLYETTTGTKVIFNYGGSGELKTQIATGAPVDVFASAAQKDMDELAMLNLIDTVNRVNFAANSVVLIVPAGAANAIRSFEDLGAVRIQRIAIGNPKTVPAGRYAEEVFAYYKLFPAIREKLIYTENVRQALDYVARGEVDAGIVYATDMMARRSETRIIATAPKHSHKDVIYPIAVVKSTMHPDASKGFIQVVRSKEGNTILHKYGFKTLAP